MGDAYTNSTQMELESIVEEEYFEALFKYLGQSNQDNKANVSAKMLRFAEVFKEASMLRELRLEFEKLEANDINYWKLFSQNAEKSIFKIKPGFKNLFLSAAQTRCIGKFEWVV